MLLNPVTRGHLKPFDCHWCKVVADLGERQGWFELKAWHLCENAGLVLMHPIFSYSLPLPNTQILTNCMCFVYVNIIPRTNSFGKASLI